MQEYFPQEHACEQHLDETDRKMHVVGTHLQSYDKIPKTYSFKLKSSLMLQMKNIRSSPVVF